MKILVHRPSVLQATVYQRTYTSTLMLFIQRRISLALGITMHTLTSPLRPF